MRKVLLSAMLCLIFLAIVGEQFYKNYQFRVQAPSEKWAKEVVISKGKLKNSPKVIKFDDKYIVVHDDNNKIRIIALSSLGKKLYEKELDGRDYILFDVNLLTDGNYIYVNWIYSVEGKNKLINLKLDKEFKVVEETLFENPKASIQIGDNVYAVSYEDRIEVVDIKSKEMYKIDVMQNSKLCGTKTKDGFLIAYYTRYGFYFTEIKDGKLSDSKLLAFRWPTYGEIYLDTAIACDEKNGYLIVDRKIKKAYGLTMMVTFRLDSGGEDQFTQAGPEIINIDTARDMDIFSLVDTDFTYSPVGISSGVEARFMVGVARPYGRSERQFDIIEFGVKDGEVTNRVFLDNSRKGTTMPYSSGEISIYCNQIKTGYYEVCFTSQSDAYKSVYNVVRGSEIWTAVLDTLSNIANSIFGILTIGLKWILPGLMLISIFTFFGHRLSEKRKKLVFLCVCIISIVFKVIFAKNLFYEEYSYKLPQTLSSVGLGIGIFIIISILSYYRGYVRYEGRLLKNPDDLPLLAFIIALFTDSILTQLIYTPFIM